MSSGDGRAGSAGAAPGAALECAAYSLPVKALATALLAALVVAAWRSGVDPTSADWTAAAKASLAVVVIGVAVGYGWILASRTSIDATRIRQSWLWPKQVLLADITQARFIYLPGLTWIVAPRLVVRARGRKAAVVFPAAGRAVLAEFARLSLGAARG